MTDTELSWFVDLTVTRELSAVPGVGRVTRVGGVDARDSRRSRSRSHGRARRDGERRLAAAAPHPSRVPRRRRRASAASSRPCARPASSPPSTTCAALPISLPDGRSVRLDTIADVRDQAGGAALGRAARRRARHRLPDRPLAGARARSTSRRKRAPSSSALQQRVPAREVRRGELARSATSRSRSTPRWRC